MVESHSHGAARHFAIVPAAGRSVRMGRPKLLLPWRGTTVIEAVLAAWRQSDVADVVVVVHPDDTDLATICRRAGAAVVAPPVPPPDMKVSIKHGLEWIAATHDPLPSDAWVVAPADMPQLSSALINCVVARHNPQDPQILVPVSCGRRGHPVLFPWSLAAAVADLADDQGLDVLVAREKVTEVDCEGEGPLLDMDTPDEYRNLRPDG